jgi:glycosyltransferase involved in cell wall biosynthesis
MKGHGGTEMAKIAYRKVAFISSFLPKKCGIATFTSDLVKNVKAAAGKNFEPLVVAMQSENNCHYTNPVKFEVRYNIKKDYICAADYLNFSHVDIVSVQHEFGLFGGDAGSYLNLLLQRVNAPIVTTLHTVLEEPDPSYYQSTVDVCDLSHKVIVMNQRGIAMLTDIYEVNPNKIELIEHGIPDLPFVDSSYYKHKFNMEGRRTILTFGLLSKNKGIEVMLKALPDIIKVDPTVLYIILGMTHPNVIRHEGEAYRLSLRRLVKELGLENHVIFHNQFVTDEELHNFLCAADIYVTPYLSREQLTSGTLAFAVGTGKAVVSTPYWAAEELLAKGRGKIVPFENSKSLAESIIEIINDDPQFYSLRRKAYDYGRKIIWPSIGKLYWKLFNSKGLVFQPASKPALLLEESISTLEIPEPSLEHLLRLTDDTGLWQHAKFMIPNREHGYCTDDNARALVAMTKYYSQYADPEALRLFEIYLSFVCHAQKNDGTLRNLMNYDRQWLEDEARHDALGRTLWAFGTVMAKPPLPMYVPIIKDCFDKSVKHVPTLSERDKAYAILGMTEYLKQFPGASDIKRHLVMAADHLIDQYNVHSHPDWQWFENVLTYDNAILVHALYLAAGTTGEQKYLDVAHKTQRFLLEKTYNNQHFSFIGCKGWYPRGGKKAKFDQQALEIVSTVMMLRAAYDATSNPYFLKLQKKAFDWFLGDNDLQIPIYDFRTKGCYDGLEASGINLNQGAESMVSFMLSLLFIVETSSAGRTLLDEKKAPKELISIPLKGQNPVVDLPFNKKTEESTVEKI